MARSKLPTDWRERPLDKWNSTTFRLYMQDSHLERLGIPYIARSIKTEAAMCKRMVDEYGSEIVKEFIDACFREYKPSPQYPSLNFAFCYSYMRDRVLPKVMAEMARKERLQQCIDNVWDERVDFEELKGWL